MRARGPYQNVSRETFWSDRGPKPYKASDSASLNFGQEKAKFLWDRNRASAVSFRRGAAASKDLLVRLTNILALFWLHPLPRDLKQPTKSYFGLDLKLNRSNIALKISALMSSARHSMNLKLRPRIQPKLSGGNALKSQGAVRHFPGNGDPPLESLWQHPGDMGGLAMRLGFKACRSQRGPARSTAGRTPAPRLCRRGPRPLQPRLHRHGEPDCALSLLREGAMRVRARPTASSEM